MSDREVAVETDGDEDERREVEAERAEEHAHATGDVASVPRHRHVPADLQRHHEERDDQVGDGEVHDEEVDARPPMTVAKQRDEHSQVAEAGDEEQYRVNDDAHQTVAIERHVVRQRRHVVIGWR